MFIRIHTGHTYCRLLVGKIYPLKACRYRYPGSAGLHTSDMRQQNDMSHAFILRFNSKDERDYYVNEDPAHQAFKDAAAAVVEKTIVVDFQEGVFTNE